MNVERFLIQVKQNLPEHDGVTTWVENSALNVGYGKLESFEIRYPGGICYNAATEKTDEFYKLVEEADKAFKTVKEYIDLMDKAPELSARDFNMPYKLLAEFNGVEWTLVDMYKDDGITGTEMEHRDDFNRMYQDCVDGKLDLILTKSISRFARNTYDCIDTTRKFKILGVDIIFEKENIDTGKMTSETELAVLSSMAQEESISNSQNVKLGIQHRMKNGTFKQSCLPY